MQHVTELTENVKVILKRAVEEFKASEAFKDEVIESALNMFLQGFDECQKQLQLLNLGLNLSKLRREFPTDSLHFL